MNKQAILRDFMRANMPLVYALAYKLARRSRRYDLDLVNEYVSEIAIRVLECADYWEPERCAPCTFIYWQGRAVLSRATFYRHKKSAPLRVASGENEERELANKSTHDIGPDLVDKMDTIQAVKNALGITLRAIPKRQAKTIKAVILNGQTRRKVADTDGTSKGAVDQKLKGGIIRLGKFRAFRNLAEAF